VEAGKQQLDRGTGLALFAMAAAVLVIANDFSAINVAIPQIEKDFETSVTTTQWVVNAYALTFGVLIVTGGRLADLFGRRRAFFVGSAIFASMSLAGGAAQSEAWLIAARVLMGIGGALMWPAILGMTYAILPEERAGLAGGVILGAAGLGNAIGPLLGGTLTDLLSWRWIFFVNLPITAFACLVTWRQIHQPRLEVEDNRMDYRGIVTLTASLVALLLAFDQATDLGWDDPRIIGLFCVFVVGIIGFAVSERSAGAHALVPADVMGNRDFSAACATILMMSGIFFATLLYMPQFMLKVMDFSPIGAGAGMLPMMATFAVVSFISGPLYERFGAKLLISLGAACLVLGPLLLSFAVEVDSSFASLIPGLAVTGLGVGLFYPAATTAGVTSVDESRRSLAGAIVYMFQVAGGSLGLGLTTAILIEAGDGASGAQAFVDGFDAAFRVDALIGLGGFAIAILFVGGSLRRRRVAAAG
jgi:EmrB/QacA subfamily drug resistance transporter